MFSIDNSVIGIELYRRNTKKMVKTFLYDITGYFYFIIKSQDTMDDIWLIIPSGYLILFCERIQLELFFLLCIFSLVTNEVVSKLTIIYDTPHGVLIRFAFAKNRFENNYQLCYDFSYNKYKQMFSFTFAMSNQIKRTKSLHLKFKRLSL